MPWPAYLWPGLPQLAGDGNWAALAFAVAAAALLNAVLLGTWFWTDLFAPAPRIIVWVLLGVAWSISVSYWAWADRRRAAASEKTGGKSFEEALEDYLKGNWFEAERKLNLVLRRDEHDLEARLLMATLLRHTKRFDDATHQLNLLVRIDGAHRWALEIHREGELLTEARKHTITSMNLEHESKGDN
ncbi:MAG: hypothetical protein ABSG53_29935 [Thermoguttaceae bacterium]|jgi:hypothetical protein